MEVIESAGPSLVSLPHPLTPQGKDMAYAAFLPGETLGAYIQRTGVTIARGPVFVWQNGHPVPESLWTRLIPRAGDLIVVRARMLGGGGGSKILRAVATIALVVAAVAAPYMAGLTATVNGVTSVTMGGAILSGAVMVGGSLLIGALLPPPKATYGQLGTNKFETSPTYAISGGRNRARQWEPMAIIFGRHRVVPDLGAAPYTQQEGDDQYLTQLFHFGLQGTGVAISDIRIGDTPITSYQGVQTQIAGPDGRLGMVLGNVDTIQGATLVAYQSFTRTTPTDVTYITVELAARLFVIADDGGVGSRTVDVMIEYRPAGSTGDYTVLGGVNAVYATHYWAAERDGVQMLYGSTNPAEHWDGQETLVRDPYTRESVYAVWRWRPHPYRLGQPWQGVAPDPLVTPGISGYLLTGARQEPTRRAIGWNVSQGQYEVRVTKMTPDINSSRESNETAVQQILAYQVDQADYTGQTRLAVRIRASGQLNGQIDELNAMAAASAHVWNGSDWVFQHTRNPAWWFRWFAIGQRNAAGQRIYGGGLGVGEVDTDSIIAWAAWCDQKGLTFDWVLDRKMAAAEVLQIIARAGRASPTWQSGRLGVIWDAADLPVTAMFGPFNIRAGTFEVGYVNDGTVDEIVINFANAARNYQMDEVRARVPGAAATNNPLQLDLEGCTSADMAGREANLLAASQMWHRRRVTWETDIEGYVATRGDVVSFSHDLTVWGYSGRLMPGSRGAEDGQLPLMVLDGMVPTAGTGTVLLRGPEGQMRMVSVTSASGEVDQITVVTSLDGFPMPGDTGYEDAQPLDWAWQFDPMATPGRRFKIVSVEPVNDGVRFQAIDDDPQYYASETNPYQYTPPRDGAGLSGVVFSLSASEAIMSVPADQVRVTFGWVLSREMPVRVAVSVNGRASPVQVVDGRSLDVTARTGDVVQITVTPAGSTGAGAPRSLTYTVQGLAAPLPPVIGLTSVFRDGLTVLVWRSVVDVRQPMYEVRLGDTWANGATVAITPALEQLAVGNGLYWVAARFRLSNGTVIYGDPDTLQIAGAVLVRNVLVQRDEAPAWAGTVSGGAYVYEGSLTLAPQGDVLSISDVLAEQDVLWYGGPAPSGTYAVAEADRVDIGYVTPVRIDLDVEFAARNISADILSSSDIFAIADVLNGSDRQFVTVRPQIRHAQEEGVWSDWMDYVPGLINARYFDVRLLLSTDDPLIIPYVTQFTWTVDVPDLVQHGEGLAVPPEGVSVTYAKPFHARPNVQITILDAQAGDQAVLTTSTLTGFEIRIINGATSVAREINWLAQGY